jgi:hypothetical protein
MEFPSNVWRYPVQTPALFVHYHPIPAPKTRRAVVPLNTLTRDTGAETRTLRHGCRGPRHLHYLLRAHRPVSELQLSRRWSVPHERCLGRARSQTAQTEGCYGGHGSPDCTTRHGLTPLLCLVRQAKRNKSPQRRTKRETVDQQVCVNVCEPV